jgi:hypothetical protein
MALNGDWESIGSRRFPEELKYEALIDILRGKVKVSTSFFVKLNHL